MSAFWGRDGVEILLSGVTAAAGLKQPFQQMVAGLQGRERGVVRFGAICGSPLHRDGQSVPSLRSVGGKLAAKATKGNKVLLPTFLRPEACCYYYVRQQHFAQKTALRLLLVPSSPENYTITMKAVGIRNGKGNADAFFIDDNVKDPVASSGCILVSIKAFGLNRMDIMQREDKYPYKLLPESGKILGVEFSGTVDAVGEDCKISLSETRSL